MSLIGKKDKHEERPAKEEQNGETRRRRRRWSSSSNSSSSSSRSSSVNGREGGKNEPRKKTATAALYFLLLLSVCFLVGGGWWCVCFVIVRRSPTEGVEWTVFEFWPAIAMLLALSVSWRLVDASSNLVKQRRWREQKNSMVLEHISQLALLKLKVLVSLSLFDFAFFFKIETASRSLEPRDPIHCHRVAHAAAE